MKGYNDDDKSVLEKYHNDMEKLNLRELYKL